MASLDAVSLTILLGAAMVLAGIMSSLVALRFGAPLLLVFLIIGMLAGEAGPGGVRFDDVRSTYTVGSIALAEQGLLGAAVGILGGRAMALVLNRLDLPQGLHAPFVATAALVVFGIAAAVHGSGFLAAYLAGLVVGNRRTRAHNTVIVFLDAVTWLAQIVMFVLLGLLVWPGRLPATAGPALLIAATLMLVARPAAVMLCLAPFRFSWREKLFISWVGLRGAVGIFLASIPLLVGMKGAQ